MARSRKRAIIKSKCRFHQKYGHRSLRMKVKSQLKKEDWETFPILDEVMCRWNVSDWATKIDITDMYESKWWIPKTAKIINGQVYISK